MDFDYKSVFSNIGDYLIDEGLQSLKLTKIGAMPTGNLNQKQIDSGVKVGEPMLVQTNPYSSELMRSNLFGLTGGDPTKNMILFGAAGILVGVVIYSYMKR